MENPTLFQRVFWLIIFGYIGIGLAKVLYQLLQEFGLAVILVVMFGALFVFGCLLAAFACLLPIDKIEKLKDILQ